MRIRQLDLIAYGPFQDYELVLEDPGLHLIFGQNESGKSTALRALQAVLYGMTDKRDAFRHPWDMMRVGMSLETSDGIMNVERRKGKGARSLVHVGTERAVTTEEWNRVLPVLDLNLFQQMFGLNYERLVEGGRKLAEGQGDIGQALLAAAGDLGGAVERMRGFEARAHDLFQGHARSQSKLSVAIRQFKDADRRIRSEKFSSHAYKTAVRELEDQQRESERLTNEIRTCAIEHQRLARLRQAAPTVALLAQKEELLRGMSSVRELTADFSTRHENVATLLGKALTTQEHSQSELNRLTEKLSAIRRDPALASARTEIEQLFAQSGKVDAGRKDRPKREGELRQLTEGVVRNLRLLGLERDPANCADLRVRVVQRREIARLAEEHPRLVTRLEEAGKLAARLAAEIDENRSDLARSPEYPDTTELERCLSLASGGRTEAELSTLQEQLAVADANSEAALKSLPLFVGTADELERLAAPLEATVRAYQTRFTEHPAREKKVTEEHTQTTTEISDLEGKIRHIDERGEVPTEEHLDEGRARRDLGWTAVKRRWVEGTPDTEAELGFLAAGSEQPLVEAYEDAVRHADVIADRLRRETARVEKKSLWIEQVAGHTDSLAKTRNVRAEVIRMHEELDAEWRSVWLPTSMEPLTPGEMLDWLERRRELIEQIRSVAALRLQVAGVGDLLRQRRETFASALAAARAPATGSLAELVETARRVVQRADENRTSRRDLDRERERLAREASKGERARADLETELSNWGRQWATAVAGLPVASDTKPETVQEVVRLLDAVAGDSEQIIGLTHRIGTMERDDHEFSTAVHGLAARVGLTDELSTDSLVTIKKLNEAATAAKQYEDEAASIQDDLVRIQEALLRSKDDAERQRRELAGLCKEAGVEEPDRLPEAIEQASRRRDLLNQIEEQRVALLSGCGGRSLDDLIGAVNALNLDALPAQLEELEKRQQEYEARRQQCARRAVELEQEFQFHEAAGNLSEAAAQKQDAGARITCLAEEFLEQAIAGRLMNVAIDRYRKRHQDPLLERAGEYFRDLTCGSFSGLAVDFDDANTRVMRGVRSGSNEHVGIAGMSDGARDQLFFALRLAYIEDHCGRFGACPIILDDVLMAFDDQRAAAALRVLGDLSKKTQVLVFTHHAHHVELARQTLAGDALIVHTLAA